MQIDYAIITPSLCVSRLDVYLVSLLGLSLEFNMCCMASLGNTTAHESESEDVVGIWLSLHF